MYFQSIVAIIRLSVYLLNFAYMNVVILVISSGSSTLSGKMLLYRIVKDNNKVLAYFRSGWVNYRLFCPAGLEPSAWARNRKKTSCKLISNNTRSSIKPTD